MLAVLLLALFPVLFIFDTRLGAAALVAAIVLLYRGNVAKRVASVRRPQPSAQREWSDPWGSGTSGS